MHSGARVVDLTGAALEAADDTPVVAWFPKLDSLRGKVSSMDGKLFGVPSSAANATSALALTLAKLGLIRMSVLHFHPLSKAAPPAMDNLQSQPWNFFR